MRKHKLKRQPVLIITGTVLGLENAFKNNGVIYFVDYEPNIEYLEPKKRFILKDRKRKKPRRVTRL